MRRFLVFFGIIALLVGVKSEGSLMILNERFPDAEYVFYLQSCEISVPIAEAKGMRGDLRGVRGEAVRLDSSDYAAVVEYLDGIVLAKEYASGVLVLYGYSKYLGNSVGLRGDKINFQIAVSSEGLIIGSPLIAGSF